MILDPTLIVGIAALLGAVLLGALFKRAQRSSALGGALGALGGGAGALLFMLPLNFCTFELERSPEDIFLGTLLIGAGMAICLVPLRWWFIVRPSQRQAPRAAQGTFKDRVTPWLLLLPTLIVLILFLYYPFLDTFRLSTLIVQPRARRTPFVCLNNFTTLLGDPAYLRSVLITLIITAAIVVIGLLVALLIASVAYQPIRGAGVYRTLLVWSYAISPAVAGLIFFIIFNPIAGIANYFLNNLFGVQLAWFTDPNLAVLAIILASVWKSLGFNILFYIAGLQNVPNDLREAAAIDGANTVQRFWLITVPMLSPITFFLIITNITYAFFDLFGTIDTMTAGGPVGATTTLIYRIYQDGFTEGRVSYAAAQSVILFLMVIGITYLQFRTTARRVTYGA
jgi:sn-glycerol 3-phosphate transport system permease protein